MTDWFQKDKSNLCLILSAKNRESGYGDKSNYHFSISVSEGIVEIVITGEIAHSTIERLHAEVMTILMGKNAKAVLCDISALKGRYDEFAAAFFRTAVSCRC